MRTFFRVIILSLFCFLASTDLALSQKKEGDKYYEKQQYAKALKYYNLYEKIARRDETLIRRAICHFNLGNASKCLFDLNLAERLGNKSPTLYKYRAETLHAIGKYAEAGDVYKKYLVSLKDTDPDRQRIVDVIRQCGFARNFVLKDPQASAQSLGDRINTSADEERLIESVNYPNKIYFTSSRIEGYINDSGLPQSLVNDHISRTARKDIYSSTFSPDGWTNIQDFNVSLNTTSDEKLLDFSSNGQVVFFQSGNTSNDQWLLADTVTVTNGEVRPSRFYSPINLIRGDRDLRVVNDSILIFASNSLPGYGGYDLYYITRNSQNQWSEPKNFGGAINTEKNEISPFLTRNGKKLFFSSDRIYGLGGYDVFVSNYKNNQWSGPRNMGTGVNSSKQDLDFVLSRSGNKGYVTSDRLNGNGGNDLYALHFIDEDKSNLVPATDVSFFRFDKPLTLVTTYQKNTPQEETQVQSKPQIESRKPIVESTQNVPSSQPSEIVESSKPVQVEYSEPIVDSKPPQKNVQEVEEVIFVEETPIVVEEKEESVAIEEVEKEIIVEEEVQEKTPQLPSRPIQYEEPQFEVYLALDPVTIPKKEIILEPLYYNEDENLTNNRNLDILNRIKQGLSIDKELKVVIVSHSLNEGDKAFDLFFSAKRGEQIIEELKKLGMQEKNIKLIGVGSNYPLVKQISQGKKVSLAENYNRRLDLIAYPSQDSDLSVFHKSPFVADYLRDIKYATYQDASEGLSYRIKVKDTNQILENTPLNQYSDLVIEKVGKKYRYTLGVFKTFKECKNLYDILEQNGFSNMQILPYENNILMGSNRIPLRIETYNDLINLINYRLQNR